MAERHKWATQEGQTNLRSHVVQCANPRDRGLCVYIDGQPKICQLDLVLLTQEQILRLDVSMHDALQQALQVIQQGVWDLGVLRRGRGLSLSLHF